MTNQRLSTKDYHNMEALGLSNDEYLKRRSNGNRLIAGAAVVAAATGAVALIGNAIDRSPTTQQFLPKEPGKELGVPTATVPAVIHESVTVTMPPTELPLTK